MSNLRPDASKASAVVFGGATLVRGRGSGRVRVRARVRVRVRVRVRRSDLEGPTGLRGVVTRQHTLRAPPALEPSVARAALKRKLGAPLPTCHELHIPG